MDSQGIIVSKIDLGHMQLLIEGLVLRDKESDWLGNIVQSLRIQGTLSPHFQV
jgi:hypothetical protein